MHQLSNISGKLRWKRFLEEQEGLVPFAYNPSLFDLYLEYFRWNPCYVIITRENEDIALLPLVYTGKAWVSLPHVSYGGVLWKLASSVAAYVPDESDIIRGTIDLLKKKPYGFYEFELEKIHSREEINSKYFIRKPMVESGNGFDGTEKAISHIKLQGTVDEQWGVLSSNLRRKINKAENIIDVKSGNLELLDDFYSVYTDNIKALGSLAYSKDYFLGLISCFDDRHTIFVAYANDKPVGGAMVLSYDSHFENMYFAVLKQYRKLYVSDLLNWKMIVYSIEQIIETKLADTIPVYSFGRSTIDSGVFKYKNHWPVENIRLYNFTNMQDIRKNRNLLKIWKLLPGFITRPLGARLVRGFY